MLQENKLVHNGTIKENNNVESSFKNIDCRLTIILTAPPFLFKCNMINMLMIGIKIEKIKIPKESSTLKSQIVLLSVSTFKYVQIFLKR
jgi:hypothetical protein